MAATSVTGTGIGDSNGKYKPENSSGCCGIKKQPPEEEIEKPNPIGCHVKLKYGSRNRLITGNNSNLKVCR
jgi:hypothetical protein